MVGQNAVLTIYNLFQDKQVICLHQAGYIRRNSLLVNAVV